MMANILFIFVLITSSLASEELSIGDTLVFNAGYGNFLGMSGGSTQTNEVIDSISISGDTTSYRLSITSSFTGGFFENRTEYMKPLITEKVAHILILTTVPHNVKTSSSFLKKCRWLVSSQSTAIFYNSILPISKLAAIPVFDESPLSQPAINYVVRFSDTIGMNWSNTDKEKERFTGRLLRFKNSADSVGSDYSDSLVRNTCGDVPTWTSYQAVSPLSFTSISVSSSEYPLDKDSMMMGEGCYRMSLYYYKPIKKTNSVFDRNKSITSRRANIESAKYLPNGVSLNRTGGGLRFRIQFAPSNYQKIIDTK